MGIANVLTGLGSLILIGSLPAQEKKETPGNPPQVLIASQIDKEGNLVLVNYRTIFLQPAGPGLGGGPIYNDRSTRPVSLKGVKIHEGGGKEITVEEARKRIGPNESAILVTSWGQKLMPVYRPLFKSDILLFSFPKDAPSWEPIQAPELPVR